MAGEVCGALSGAVLAIGLIYGEDQEEAVPHLAESFMNLLAGAAAIQKHEQLRHPLGYNQLPRRKLERIAQQPHLLPHVADRLKI